MIAKHILVASLLVVFTMAGYAEQTHPVTYIKDSKMTQKIDKIKPIVLSDRQRTFTVSLPANPTTGYQWVLIADYDSDFIKPDGYHYEPGKQSKTDQKLVGAPGTAVFKFKAKDKFKDIPQVIELHFAYIRFWDPADHPAYQNVKIISGAP